MRELGRGGALVAAAVAQLENKANTRLMKTHPSSKNGATPPANPAKRGEAQNSSDEEEDKGTKMSDKDSSIKSSRDTSEVEEVSSSSESESDSESDEDRTQGSVLENVVEEPKITSPERG